MAIIYTYPRLSGQPEGSDLVLITDVSDDNKSKNTTIQSINDLGPQGTVTDVTLTMPSGFTVTKNTSNGAITLDVTGDPVFGPAGNNTEIQFNNNGVFGANPGLSIDVSNTRTRLDLGHRLNPTGRGEIAIHSGARNQGFTQGGVLDLEYAYPTSAPVVGLTAAYAFVGLIGPEYDENLVPGDPLASLALQGYNIQLPVVTPSDNTQTTYTDARLLVVNATTTGADPVHQSKWISPDDLGIGAGGVNNNVQFNNNSALAGDNSFNYFVSNNAPGTPGNTPTAHELQLGAGGGQLPGMLTLFGDDDPQETQGTSGILRFITSTGTDYASITGPDIQTELSINDGGTGYQESNSPVGTTTSGNGTGMQVYITGTDASGTIISISVAQQGSGYTAGDTVRVDDGDANSEILVVSASQGPANEAQIYDIKLPKYAPLDDKIWFGKTTDPTVSLKEGELTTNDFFKIPLVDFDPGEGHFPGGRLQLTIGSPNSNVNEPWGSILLNGGNNTNESGVIRLASVFNNTVGIMGPKAATPPQGVSYNYDFMLPYLPPEEAQLNFINGVDTVSIETPGTGHSTANRIPASGGSGTGCVVNITATAGAVTGVTIVDFGDNYQIDDILTINQNGVPDPDKATIKVTGLKASLAKVLVINENASNTQAFPHETRWIDFPSGGSDLVIEDEGTSIAATASTINFTGGGVSAAVDPNDANKVNVDILPRLNQGFSPFPIYLGDDTITVSSGTTLAIACNTICDIASPQITVARVYGDVPINASINVAVYSGELGDTAATQLIAYGEAIAAASITGRIYRINLNDMIGGTTWAPVAGTPIVVVIEIDNRSGDSDCVLLGKAPTQGGAQGLFGTLLAWSIEGTSSVFNSTNIAAGEDIEQLLGFDTDREETSLRVCHHFDPFAP